MTTPLIKRQPPTRGRLMTPEEVAQWLNRSPAWVRRNVPNKQRIGHSTVRWFERDIITWLEALAESEIGGTYR